MKTVLKDTTLDGFADWTDALIARSVRVILEQIAKRSDAKLIQVVSVDERRGLIDLRVQSGHELRIEATPTRLRLVLPGMAEPLQEERRAIGNDGVRDAERFVDIAVAYINTSFLRMAVRPPFVELSLRRPLDDDSLQAVSNLFSVTSERDYSRNGVVGRDVIPNSIEQLRVIAQASREELKNIPDTYTPLPGVRAPARDQRGKSYSHAKMRRLLRSTKFAGREPHDNVNRIVWGVDGDRVGDLAYEQTVNLCDYLTYCCRGADRKRYRVTLYATPVFQSGFEETFAAELRKFIERFEWRPDWSARFDMPVIMRTFWDRHADEDFLTGGFVWHRDGVWGAHYDVAGAGMGNMLDNDPRELFFCYTFVPPGAGDNTSGMLRMFTDSNNASTQGASWVPNWTDLNWYFYPGQPIDDIMQAIRNYSHSY